MIRRTVVLAWALALGLWAAWLARGYVVRARVPDVRGLQYELELDKTPDKIIGAHVRVRVHVAPGVEDVDFEIEERDALHPAGEPATLQGPKGPMLDVPFDVVPRERRKPGENQLPLVHERLVLGAGGDLCPVPVEAAPDTPVTVAIETFPKTTHDRWQIAALAPDGWRRSRDLGGVAVLALTAAELERSLLYAGPLSPLIDGDERLLVALVPEDEPLVATLRACALRLDELAEPAGHGLVLSQTTTTFHVPAWSLGTSHLSAVDADDPASVEDAVTRLALARLRASFELPPERAWWLHGVARRTAIALSDELLGRPEERAWRDRLAAYVFYAATQDGPLSTPSPTGHQRHCLLELKAPLLVRGLERGPVELATWRAFLARLASGAGEEDALRATLGEEAALAFRELGRGDGPLRDPRAARDLSLAPRPRSETSTSGERFVLALTANTENYLETCGCKLRQQGGIARRATALERARREAPVLALDLGNLAPRGIEPFQVDALVRGEVALHLEAAAGMGYAGFALGPNELALGAPFVDDVQRASGVRLQGCNAGSDRSEAPWRTDAVTTRVGDRDVRLIAATATTPYWIASEELARHLGGVAIDEPEVALERELRDAGDDELTVVYGQLPPWKVHELVARFPEIDVVATSDRWVLAGTSARAHGPDGVGDVFLDSGFLGDTFVALANEESHGLALIDLTVADGRVASFAERLVTLDETLPEHAGVRARIDALYASVELEGFHPQAKKLFLGYPGERALLAEGARDGRRGYVGAEACRACHAAAFDAWSATPHATAFATLIDAGRDRSPACVGCHVVGFGLPSGYEIDREERAHLAGVQCEVCHGPGAEHVAFPSVTTIRPTIPVDACGQCHDSEHSEPLAPRLEEAWRIGAHRIGDGPHAGAHEE